jgi:Skp family chaperone for outer membrane proteins
MKLSQQLLLLSIPSSIGLGIAVVSTNTTTQSHPELAVVPTQWRVQAVETPKIVSKTPHQVFVERQKQLSNRDFNCDCNGCRLAAAQMGIKIN